MAEVTVSYPLKKGLWATSPKAAPDEILPWATGCWALPISPRAALFTPNQAEVIVRRYFGSQDQPGNP